MALQGVIFGACQAGITALTERLHEPDQAGLVYAAMGVMSAVAGLSLALVPARIALPTRWRAAAVALVVLSVPLLFVRSLGALYPVVVVLGVAFAPHLITLFGLTERLVPAGRLAESMAFLTSAWSAARRWPWPPPAGSPRRTAPPPPSPSPSERPS